MTQIDEVLIMLVGLIGLWFLHYFFLKEQRVDEYREGLLALRDELFDLARSGKIRYSHGAYTDLRLVLNGHLRFAHRVNLIGLGVALVRSRLRGTAYESHYAKWKNALRELSPATRDNLTSIHQRTFRLLARQLFTGSGLRYIFFVALAIYKALIFCEKIFAFSRANFDPSRAVELAVVKFARSANAKAFEEDAYYSGREARSRFEELQAV